MKGVDLRVLDRKSIPYFGSEHRAALEDWARGNGHMFFEDVHNQVLPYRSAERSGYEIAANPDDEVTKERLVTIFSSTEPPYRELTYHLSDFIREVAGQIAFWGIVHYEITQVEAVPAKDGWRRSFRGIAVGERLRVPARIPGRVLMIGPRVFQIIPKAERGQGRPPVVLLPKSKVWSIGVPESLGGMRGYRSLRKCLIEGGELIPRFAKGTSWLAERNLDMKAFLSQRHPLVAKGSSMWGWPARSLWRGETLEYYELYRHLRFARALSILRQHVLSDMNQLLRRTQVSAELTLRGLPSVIDIEECLRKLDSGSISFRDSYKIVGL
jgi:hypothetical protein